MILRLAESVHRDLADFAEAHNATIEDAVTQIITERFAEAPHTSAARQRLSEPESR